VYQFELQRLLSIFGQIQAMEAVLVLADRISEKANLDGAVDFPMSDEDTIRSALLVLGTIYLDCEAVELRLCCDQIERLQKSFVSGCKAREIIRLWADLKNRITDELNGRITLSIPRGDAEQYQNVTPFGVKVAEKFERALTDMQEASKCLALDRPTACVFHLMRVMEYAVQRFGKKLGVKLTDTKTWQKILNELNAPIKQMPEQSTREKKRKEDYAALHAHLFNVKLAWRNPVMHPKATYTPAEARDVFNHVDTFMRHLAMLI
jgi:hypothetical protein